MEITKIETEERKWHRNRGEEQGGAHRPEEGMMEFTQYVQALL